MRSIKHPYLKTVDITVHRVDEEEVEVDTEEEEEYSPKLAREKNRRAAAAGRKKTNPKKTPVRENTTRRKALESPVLDESLLKTVSLTVTSPPINNPFKFVQSALQQSPAIKLPEVKLVTSLALNSTAATSKNDGTIMKV